MELSQLKYFMSVAKSQHMTLAAKQMHVAQPSITKAIHRLEDELQVSLIQKKGRNIELTADGKILYDYLKEPLKKIEEIPNLLHQMEEEKSRTIRLNVLAASRLVTDAIIAYKHTHPNINFSIVQNEQDTTCDVLIDTTMGPRKNSHHSHYFKEDILLAVPKTSRYAHAKDFELKDVKEEGFISLAGHRKFRSICDHFCLEEGFVPKVIFESDSPAAVRNLIGAGSGIGFWPEYTWQDVGEDVVLIPLKKEKFRRQFQIRLIHNDERSQAFYEYLVAYFREVKENSK